MISIHIKEFIHVDSKPPINHTDHLVIYIDQTLSMDNLFEYLGNFLGFTYTNWANLLDNLMYTRAINFNYLDIYHIDLPNLDEGDLTNYLTCIFQRCINAQLYEYKSLEQVKEARINLYFSKKHIDYIMTKLKMDVLAHYNIDLRELTN